MVGLIWVQSQPTDELLPPRRNRLTPEHAHHHHPRAKSLTLLGTTADELLFDFDVLMGRRLVDYADKRLIFTWENQVGSSEVAISGGRVRTGSHGPDGVL